MITDERLRWLSGPDYSGTEPGQVAAELLTARDRIRSLEALLTAANCPNERNTGHERTWQCQWCDERNKLTVPETFDVKKEVMQNAGNSNKPDHAKPGAASGDNTPKCFFCGWPLETHSNNVQGHPWRRGSSVTDADLALNRQTETACGAAVSPTHQHGPECPILYGYACNCTPIPLGTK